MMNKPQIIPQQTARPQPQFNNVPYQPTQMTPGQAEYWRLNGANGQAANEAINRMPFVLDPASMFGQDRSQIMASMYQPKPAGDAAQAQAPATPASPAEQMLALLQSNPELLPIIMQQLQPQQQQTITPSNQGP
jgi:hypothetical protein